MAPLQCAITRGCDPRQLQTLLKMTSDSTTQALPTLPLRRQEKYLVLDPAGCSAVAPVFNFSALSVRASALESRQSFRGDRSCLKAGHSYFKENRKMLFTHNYPVPGTFPPSSPEKFRDLFPEANPVQPIWSTMSGCCPRSREC